MIVNYAVDSEPVKAVRKMRFTLNQALNALRDHEDYLRSLADSDDGWEYAEDNLRDAIWSLETCVDEISINLADMEK